MTNAQAAPKISYDHGVSDKKLIGETIGMFFDRQVEKYRDREALVVRHQKVRWSWGELARRVHFAEEIREPLDDFHAHRLPADQDIGLANRSAQFAESRRIVEFGRSEVPQGPILARDDAQLLERKPHGVGPFVRRPRRIPDDLHGAKPSRSWA